MTPLADVPFSILDLSPVVAGDSVSDAFQNTVRLAKLAEELGYNRFWLAEHHNMPGIASSATAVLIGHVASHTSMIRVGSGGIMLPNHAPLVVAEQFGTLASLHPNRIDLGIGRAPGTDPETTLALRRQPTSLGQELPALLKELRSYLSPPYPGQRVRSIQSEGKEIPIWLLGSSGYSAELAGRLGLPFSFAGHFAPEQMMYAIDLYRRVFTPSEHLEKPYVMMGVNLLIADSVEEANELASSQILSFLSLLKGAPRQMEPPKPESLKHLNLQEQAFLHQRLQSSIFGDKDLVTEKISELLGRTHSDELIFNTMVYDFDVRLESYRILADIGNLRLDPSPSIG
ncbi:LLM class flavin-dependent oxidoreductase [Leptospira ognonensis]|uniref:Luciferase-like monooxygenase n=1 Tax=Leptospira ognonensis TaxID=2484945 RepID=A0A4R9K6D7_9LEPT|nr:LLM class flavin-dependent oxidoreductase [Leptospira ognonensis]TGL60198.1 LLM class flavin-dependent oxidoreductase [Leptospira ognonensis]